MITAEERQRLRGYCDTWEREQLYAITCGELLSLLDEIDRLQYTIETMRNPFDLRDSSRNPND